MDEIDELVNQLSLPEDNQPDDKSSICGVSYYEVECLMPDYLFGRLDAVNRQKFEIGITHYPDLEKDYQDTKTLFDEIEKIDFDTFFKSKSQYLPSRVAQRLEARGKLSVPTQPNIRRLVLITAFAASMLIYMYFSNPKTDLADIQIINNISSKSVIFNDLERKLLSENIDEDYIINELNYIADYNTIIAYNQLNDYTVQLYAQIIDDIIDFSSKINANYGYELLIEHCENIDENTFQDILSSISDI